MSNGWVNFFLLHRANEISLSTANVLWEWGRKPCIYHILNIQDCCHWFLILFLWVFIYIYIYTYISCSPWCKPNVNKNVNFWTIIRECCPAQCMEWTYLQMLHIHTKPLGWVIIHTNSCFKTVYNTIVNILWTRIWLMFKLVNRFIKKCWTLVKMLKYVKKMLNIF